MAIYMFMIAAALRNRNSKMVFISNPLLYANVANIGISPKDTADMTIRIKPKNFIYYVPLV